MMIQSSKSTPISHATSPEWSDSTGLHSYLMSTVNSTIKVSVMLMTAQESARTYVSEMPFS